MHPRTLRLGAACFVLAGLALLSAPPVSLSQEDTAHLVLKKKAAAMSSPPVYIVQKGDNLSTIIRRKLGKPAAESASVRRQLRQLNPQIRNPDRIYPGQRIALPRLGGTPGEPAYVVRRGDTLSQILHARLGIAAGEMAEWIRLVRKLNPGLSDPDRIYPGQALLLPRKGPAPAAPAEQAETAERQAQPVEPKALQLTDRELDIVSAVVRRSGGSLVRSGKYFVPLTETEHLAVDCADIPMAELDDGSRIFLDFGRRIPDGTTDLVRARWGNFTVLNDAGDGVFSAMERLFGASRDYVFRKREAALSLGTSTGLALRADWILARRSSDGAERILAGIFRAPTHSPPIPAPLARYAEGKGVAILEIDEGSGTVRDRQETPAPAEVPVLQTGGNRVFAGSLLDALGYAYKRDQQIPIPDASTEGGPRALRTDYSVQIGARTVMIHVGDLPSPVQVKLNERGTGLILIAGGDDRKTVVEKVLKGLDVPYASETEEFRLPGGEDPPRWALTLSAFRITSAGGTLYLVPDDADRGICAFIRERWNRRIVLY
ncbi:MAG: LysM peptidoglycan-binding domain-containing protein [Syntrophales bacterium]|nr:LysM peptidoglycan-binding domain-containing protein [Syntrophales bacterium]